jgi:hypothetical protein
MAHAFTITDGTNTFTITSTHAAMQQYDMGAPDERATVVDTVNLHIRGTTGANMQTNVRLLESLLEGAKRRQRLGIGARVYVTCQLDSDGSSWRSEIVGGALDLSAESLKVWANNMMPAQLTIERRREWEASSLTELQLSAPNQSAATGGRTIYNHWDGDTGHGFWVQIAAAQVGGNVPTPARLELTNNVGGARAFAQFHIAVNSFNDPANFVGRIEGESASSGGSTAADATCSNGNKRNLTVNTSLTVTWALNDAFVTDASGNYMWLIARVLGLTDAVVVRPEIRTASGTVVWRANEPVRWITSTPHLAIVCTIPIPPGGWDAPWDDLVLALVFASSASVTLSIDYLAFFPADNYQFVPMLGESVANNETIIVDGIEGYAGVANGGLMRPIVAPRGKPLLLYPNTLQRIYILQNISNNSNIADTLSVKVSYRARRLTV